MGSIRETGTHDMVKAQSNIPLFEIQAWTQINAKDTKYDLASSCADPISIGQLVELSDNKSLSEEALSLRKLTLSYGALPGSDTLRDNLAALYSARQVGVTKEDILITNGAVDADNIVLNALISSGDHVICQYPIWEQLFQIPRSLGAEVSFWKTDQSRKWRLDTDELTSLLRPETKMIMLNNPVNPTGAIIPKPTLEKVMEIAAERGILVLCDEVFRPLFHSILPSNNDFPPSAINLGYKNVIAVGSFSKAYSMAGIRVGWIASRNQSILEACAGRRYYTTTSVSLLDQAVAAEAVSDRCVHSLLSRNIQLAQKNVALLQGFIDEHSWSCSWVPPSAGATAFVKIAKMGKPVDDVKFCLMLKEKTGVLLVPGSICFGEHKDFRGYVRIGLAMKTEKLKGGLAALAHFMEDEFENVPVAPKSTT